MLIYFVIHQCLFIFIYFFRQQQRDQTARQQFESRQNDSLAKLVLKMSEECDINETQCEQLLNESTHNVSFIALPYPK